MATQIKLLRDGNTLCVWRPGDAARRLLEQALSYDRVQSLHGRRRAEVGAPVEILPTECFAYSQGSLLTNYGYRQMLLQLLEQQGYEVVYRDLRPHPRPEVYVPQWDRISHFKLRYKQREVLQAIVDNDCGRIDCPTGWGKSFLVALLGLLWPLAKIDITTKSADISRRFYSDLMEHLPDVGLIGAGKRRYDCRVQIYCAGSLRHSPYDADVLIRDEGHELAAPTFVEHLSAYGRSRNYLFSASHNQRMDKADFELQGLFGPVIYRVTYQAAKQAESIVPIEVRWRDVVTDTNPSERLQSVPMKRRGVWRHRYRNEQIVKDARSYGDDVQVLIVVETIEHMMYLKQLLPEFKLVYSEGGLSAEDRLDYIHRKLLPADTPLMTPTRRHKLRQLFETGQLKKVIATGVWNRGVDFRKLRVLIRADAGGSDINDTQIPGRVSRTSAGKALGVVHDYRDQFDRRFLQRAQKREANYVKHGWTQVGIDSAQVPRRRLFHGR
jgi:superfamily II DNA or RNA helicase